MRRRFYAQTLLCELWADESMSPLFCLKSISRRVWVSPCLTFHVYCYESAFGRRFQAQTLLCADELSLSLDSHQPRQTGTFYYATFEQTNFLLRDNPIWNRDGNEFFGCQRDVPPHFLSEIPFKTGVGSTMPNTSGLDLFAHCSVDELTRIAPDCRRFFSRVTTIRGPLASSV